MKVVKGIKNFILGIFVIVFFIFVIINTILMLNLNGHGVTEFENETIVVMKNKSASDRYKKNDVLVISHKRLDAIDVGDEIFVYKTQSTGGSLVEFGTVGAVHIEDKAISFENGATYSESLIIGEIDKVLSPNIGRVLGVVQSTWGFLFIILVPSFLIFVYELYAIVVEIKYGGKEAEE